MGRASRFVKDIIQYMYEKLIYNQSYDRYVLMFHVVSNKVSSWYDKDYSISLDKFIYLVEQFVNAGFTFVSTKDFLDNDVKRKILLTFDDAYDGVYYNVFPVLRAKNIPFTVFQTWNYLNKEGYLSDFMINEMLRYKGFELGSHALEHAVFSQMKNDESLLSLLESKKKLEKKFEVDVTSVAFPYGSISAVKFRDIKNAEKIQYKCAFGTVNTGVGRSVYNKYYLPRINVNEANAVKVMERCIGINEY